MSGPVITEFHYYNLYQPTRAYHVSDDLTKVKNIYSKEEKEVIENKGSVKVKYELLDGTSIKDDTDVIKDSVIENIETKYYLDKEGNRIIVSEVKTPKTVDYDTTKLKLSEIASTSGKKYKLVGLKNTSSPEKGKVTLGNTVITYVYKLANGGNVYEKYMIEGTETELVATKQLTKEAMIGDKYISNVPEAGMTIKKDGKTYIYKGHRSTSASEKGVVGENEKIVIYDFVEYFSEKGEPEVQPELPEGVISEKGEPEVLEKPKFLYGKGDFTINEINKTTETPKVIENIKGKTLPNTGSTSTETTTLGLLSLIGIEVARRKLKSK